MATEPTHVGRVFVWGLDGTIAYTGMLITENEPQSGTFTDDITRHASKSKKGETIGLQLYDPNPKFSVTFLPCATATGAGAVAAARVNAILPAIGSKVTIADMPPDPAATSGEGTGVPKITSAQWIYLGGGTIGFTSEAEVTITLPLERFNSDLAVNNT